VTFIRRLRHPQDKVWRTITESEHLAVWFPQEIVGERRVGAPLRFVGPTGDAFEGTMIEFAPPSVIEFGWGGDRVRIELRADGPDTVLTLTDRFAELGKAARDAAGWHECLDRLEYNLNELPPPVWGERWRAVHPGYVGHFGPDASSIGPPPGWETPDAGGP
jgi:uncharacterized protein YndB with AHSA1/START domain